VRASAAIRKRELAPIPEENAAAHLALPYSPMLITTRDQATLVALASGMAGDSVTLFKKGLPVMAPRHNRRPGAGRLLIRNLAVHVLGKADLVF
jgi:hypothetical protein